MAKDRHLSLGERGAAVATTLLLAASGTMTAAHEPAVGSSKTTASAAPVVHHGGDQGPAAGTKSKGSSADTNAAASASPVPSIAAFQSNSGDLWTVGSAGWTDWNVGIASRTSPAVVALPGGGYEVAFQANSGDLWTVGTAGWTDWQLQMAPRTSPGISPGPSGGAIEAYQAPDGTLWTVGRSGYPWKVGMAAGTNPAPLGNLTGVAASPSTSSAPTDNNYAFEVQNSAGIPARWNPCEAVRYVVDPYGAPAGWQNDISNDMSQVSQATGLSLVNGGTTGTVPSGFNGIVISWTSQLSGGDTVGLTTYSYYNSPGFTPQIVGANIQLLSSLSGGGGMNGEQPVLLHELGHALGLAHVNAQEVMNPVDQGYSSYHAGDLNGLAQLGASKGCAGFYS